VCLFPQALVTLSKLLSDAQERHPALYTLLKWVVKKEGVAPTARRVAEERAVPVFQRRRTMTKACQAAERAFGASVALAIAFHVLPSQDAVSQPSPPPYCCLYPSPYCTFPGGVGSRRTR